MRRAEVPQAFTEALRLHEAGNFPAAEKIYRDVLDAQRTHDDAGFYLGLLLHQTDRSEEGLTRMLKALERLPANAIYHANVSVVYQKLGNAQKAMEHASIAIRLKPDYADAHFNLGLAYRDLGRMEEAIAAYRRAIELRPTYYAAYNNLGTALLNLQRPAEALAAETKAIELAPRQPEPYNNIGRVYKMLGRFEEATAALQRAIELRPRYADAWNNLAGIHLDMGSLDEAITAYAEAEACDPAFDAAGSNRLMALNYKQDVSPDELFAAHVEWARLHATPPAIQKPHEVDRKPERRLRVGYVSADFREHSVATFLEPLLAAHDPAQLEITCYSQVIKPDPVTARFKTYAHRWRDIARSDDAAIDDLVRADQIDILVDLSGHTAEHRLKLFARKPAPVQVSYLGWQNTTGMSAIDYRITDVHLDPPGLTDCFHTEKLIRLPETVGVYRPPDESPPTVSDLPAKKNGFITFGSFAKLDKITPQVLALWVRVLRAIPDSRLIIRAPGLHSPATCQQLLRKLCATIDKSPIAENRVESLGTLPMIGYLQEHARVDIVLDTFPFNGHTTACHGLWMGVPMLTLAGDRYASRMGFGVLTNLNLPQFIAHSPDEFVRRAIDLAADLPALSAVRAGLRERMCASALMDGPRLARHFESALREMWREYCRS